MSLITPVHVTSKLPDVGTTIFSVIGQLSAQHRAINLSQGAPNFPCDPQLVAGVAEAMQQGHNQYAPMTGLPALKQALADKVQNLYGRTYDVAVFGAAGLVYLIVNGLLTLLMRPIERRALAFEHRS